jgi:single-strand DNA-binding protein
MPSRATVHLMGHAGRDGELRYTGAGTACYSFSVATNESMGKEREPVTTWWEVTVWGAYAETLNNGDYPVRKGDLVVLEGSTYLEPWTGKDGAARQSLKVKAQSVVSLGKRNGDAPADEGDEDIPF